MVPGDDAAAIPGDAVPATPTKDATAAPGFSKLGDLR